MMNIRRTHRDKNHRGRLARVTGHLVVILFSSMIGISSSSFAGAFIFAGEANGVDVITHPSGYSGTGGTLAVGMCINPASVNTNEMQIPVQNIVNTINNLTVTTNNLKIGTNNNVPSNFFDFESVALHEVGHCIGLAHVNASSESGLSGNDMNYTKATNGADNFFNIATGNDGIIGSSDDVRGDDVNLHWFNNAFNNPFDLVTPVDSSTYSRQTSNLPAGHLFAVNADRSVSTLLGVSNSETIMQQGTGVDEAQRTLVADDVATLKYAMSGLDETAGTPDDYTLNLVYRGVTTTNCDVTISFDNAATFAFCQPAGISIGATGHIRITSATIAVNDAFNWFFNNVSNTTDTTPNTFTFTDQTNVPLNSTLISNAITVSGIIGASTISVVGGAYSINGGLFVTADGTVIENDTVTVLHSSSTIFLTATNTTLTVGGISDTFTSTTFAEDTTPNVFTFTDQTNVALNTLITSNNIIVSGINSPAVISITGGEYSIKGGAFTPDPGIINNGDTLVVRHTSSASISTATNTTLTISGISDTFSSTTLVGDTAPDAFAFLDQTNVALNTLISSNSITVSGINSPAAISITGGEYNINGGAFTPDPGMINNGNTVVVRHTSSASAATVTNTTLTIGGISDTFSSTTLVGDTTPDAFAFMDQTNVALNTLITSNSVTVSGINSPTAISIIGGQYSISGAAFTPNTGMINNGDTVVVRHTSSVSVSTVTNTTLTIGGISDTFSSTTLASDTIPDAFTFTDQSNVALNTLVTSNSITVSGITSPAAISVSDGEYSIRGGAFTLAPGMINNDDTVVVRHTSSANSTTATNTVLSIGGVSDTFTSVTLATDTTPNQFVFADKFNVPLNSITLSNSIIVTGINSLTSITVTDGEYNVNGGAYTSAKGVVNNVDNVVVRHTSSENIATVTSTTLTIGGINDIFSSTTLSIDITPNDFTFTEQVNAPLNSLVTSNTITVSGIIGEAPLEVSNGQYSVNSNAVTSAASTVQNGDIVVVQHTSSASPSTTTTTVLSIGSVDRDFISTTRKSADGGSGASGPLFWLILMSAYLLRIVRQTIV